MIPLGKLTDILTLGVVGAVGYLAYNFIKDPAGLGGLGAFLKAPFENLKIVLEGAPKTATEFQERAAADVPSGTSLWKLESGDVVKINPVDYLAIEKSMPTGAETFAEKVEWYVAPKVYTAEPWSGTLRTSPVISYAGVSIPAIGSTPIYDYFKNLAVAPAIGTAAYSAWAYAQR